MEQSFNRTWAGPGSETILGCTDDGNGSVYLAGNTQIGSESEALLIKYSETGTLDWYRLWNWTGNDAFLGVATDGKGNVFVAGSGQKHGTDFNNYDPCLVKFASNGTQLWNRTIVNPLAQSFSGVAIDSAGNCYAVGLTNRSVIDNYAAMIFKYATNGTLLWNQTWGEENSLGQAFGQGIAVDEAGDILITGQENETGAGNFDAFLVKYSPAGTQLWNRTWGGPELDFGSGIITDANLNIYICGSTYSFGAGGCDAFLAKYSPAGTQLWNRTWGSSDDDWGYGVAVDSAGNPCMVGFSNTFGPFIVKYSIYGVQVWNVTWGNPDNDNAYCIATNANGHLFIGGNVENLTTDNQDAIFVNYAPLPVPSAPTLGTITPSTSTNGTMFMSWTASSGATSYNLYRYTHPITMLNDSVVPVGTFKGTSGSNTVHASATYYFVVTAVNASGESNISNYQSGNVALPPSGPTLISVLPATSTNGTLTITWSTSPGATSYTLYRYSHPILLLNGTVATVGTFSTTSGTDSVFANGTWYYAVTATNATGTSGLSNTLSAVVAITPPRLTNGAVSPLVGMPTTPFTFSITYTDINGYGPEYIQVVVDGTVHALTFQSGSYTTGANFSVSGVMLDAGSHSYQFTCSDAVSVASTALVSGPLVDGTPPTNPTASCAQLNGTTINGTWQDKISQPEFSWSGASDPISGVAGYYVYWGTSATGTSTTFVTSTTYDPAAVTDGTYYLRVMTKDVAGNNATSWVTLYVLRLDTTAPSNPTAPCDQTNGTTSNGTAQSAVSEPAFTWSGASDSGGVNASGVAGYYVYWGTSPTGTSTDFVTSAAYDPAAVPVNSTYYLRVMTTDAAGNNATWVTLYVFVYYVSPQQAPPGAKPISPITWALLIGLPAAAVCIIIGGSVLAKRRRRAKNVRKSLPQLDKGFGAKV
jgi:hypothetical protein